MGCHSDYKYLPLALLLAIYQFSESDRQVISGCECCYLCPCLGEVGGKQRRARPRQTSLLIGPFTPPQLAE